MRYMRLLILTLLGILVLLPFGGQAVAGGKTCNNFDMNEYFQVTDLLEARGQSPYSSAAGKYQFINKTWLSMFRKRYPEFAHWEDKRILRKKDNLKFAHLTERLMETLTKRNRAVLVKAGVKCPDGPESYTTHVLGGTKAPKFLLADDDSLVKEVLTKNEILFNSIYFGGVEENVLTIKQAKAKIKKKYNKMLARVKGNQKIAKK